MKGLFKELREIVKEYWGFFVIVIVPILVMISIIIYAVFSYEKPVDYAGEAAYKIWYEGINSITYEGLEINITDIALNSSKIKEEGLKSVDASKVNMRIELNKNTILIQKNNTIGLYNRWLGSDIKYSEIDFSKENPIPKMIKSEWLFCIISFIVFCIILGALSAFLCIIFGTIIEKILFEIEIYRQSKKNK